MAGPAPSAPAVDLLGADDERPALLEAATGVRVSYRELGVRVRARAESWRQRDVRGLAFLRCRNDLDTVVAYLAALTAGLPIALFDAGLDERALDELRRRYQPELVITGVAEERAPLDGPPAAPELALLLSTSGSTGSPKLVRLSRGAVESNARAIAAALRLDRDEVAPTSLPLHYSYGLSVLNSHLCVGAAVLLTDEGLLGEAFWAACRAHRVTSLAGVPYSYQMLRRLDLAKLAPPELRNFTQAGGRLDPRLISHAHQVATARGGRLFVMYGQTEATARISVLAPEELPAQVGSVGRAIHGALTIEDGEVVYRGPNVMLGYAEERADLARGDELGGCLRTGDLGYLDDAGRLWITGRKKRIAKVFGMRINLEDIEAWLRAESGERAVAAVAGDDKLTVFVEGEDDSPCAGWRALLAERTGLHPTGFVVRARAALPKLPSGKLDYAQLEREAGAPAATPRKDGAT
ncbi:MAG: AMP-binding protein [Kofleriaceae bacterium]